MKSFGPKTDGDDARDPPPHAGGRSGDANFRGEKRSNATHVSTTDRDARLYGKGPGMEARLAFLGHALMGNRSGFLIDARVARADGHAERIPAIAMIEPLADRPRSVTLGADPGYDAEDFVNELRSMNVRPHVTQKLSRYRGRSATDGRTTSHESYAASQRVRKRIEEGFNWMKSIAAMVRPNCAGSNASDGPSPLPRPPTTSSGSPS